MIDRFTAMGRSFHQTISIIIHSDLDFLFFHHTILLFWSLSQIQIFLIAALYAVMIWGYNLKVTVDMNDVFVVRVLLFIHSSQFGCSLDT